MIGDDNHTDTEPVCIKVTITEDASSDKVPVSDTTDQYAASEDNIAPVSTAGKIKKLELDFSRVKESGVAPSDLKMTAIKGSKLVTKDKVKDASSVKTSGGVKAKVNKKTLAVTITCKKSGTATFTMEDGNTYTVEFNVEQPKAQKTAKYIPKKNEKVTLTTKDLFGTSIDAGELAIRKQKGKQAEIKDNALVIVPEKEDKIKVRYTYLNKKYNITVKVK